MTVERVTQVLDEAEITSADWIIGGECEGSKFHSPRPLLVRPYYLSSLVEQIQGFDSEVEASQVLLCATCSDNLTVYLSILIAYDGATPQSVRRDFGNVIRALGDRAWQHHLNRSEPAPV